MRIGLVCPYSLTVPGGVQGQVLGLAAAIRQRGYDVRVLGPCDGAPPDAGVIPLGNSLPVEANGSVAAIAPDPACQLRTLRALWDEAFDVVNVHEPFVAGPASTTVITEDAPLVGTFHAAGASSSYRYLGIPIRHFAPRLAAKVAVSRDARTLAAATVPGDYELFFNGVEVERYAQATPWPTTKPTVLFVGRHEPRKGLAELLGAVALIEEDLAVWIASDGPQTADLKARFGHDAAHRVAGADHRRRKGVRAWRAPTCSAPPRWAGSPSGSSCWRGWQRARPWSPRTSPDTATPLGRGWRRCLCGPGTSQRWPWRYVGCCTSRRSATAW